MTKNFFTPARLWAMTACLFIFNIVLIYLFLNQPVVLDSHSQDWDLRHLELRKLEDQQQAQKAIFVIPTVTPTTPQPSPLSDQPDSHGQIL